MVNIGGGRPVSVLALLEAVEAATGRRAERRLLPMPAGEVESTHASPALLEALVGYVPATPLAQGVPAFVRWYRAHYGV
jgi:UDP-glucuronate 4-epimerase